MNARALGLFAVVALSGCAFVKLKREVRRIERTAWVVGSLTGALVPNAPLYVVHVAEGKRRAAQRLIPTLPEFGLLVQLAQVNDVAAFQDVDQDGLYTPGEPCAFIAGLEGLAPVSQSAVSLAPLALTAECRLPLQLDLRSARAASGTTVGEIVSLDDPRFSDERVTEGLWSPLKAMARADYGLQQLEAHQPGRVPVVFVHGINGSPRAFAAMVASLDRTRFEPWVAYYPSGLRVPVLAQLLAGQLARARETFQLKEVFLVAHSMGGLVARGAVLELAEKGDASWVRGLLTVSTPWGGHPSAQFALDYAPEAVPSWIDLAPGSRTLRQLGDRALPVPWFVFFSFGARRDRWDENNDGVVSLPSQLPAWVQQEAAVLRGFDAGHTAVLTDASLLGAFRELLSQRAGPR